MSGSGLMDVSVGVGAMAAARPQLGESSRVNLGARRALPRDRSPSNQPPMPYPFSNMTGRDQVRYGSGARSELREREGRRAPSNGRRFDTSNVRIAEPAGQETYQDWLEALNSFNSRMETLERQHRDQV